RSTHRDLRAHPLAGRRGCRGRRRVQRGRRGARAGRSRPRRTRGADRARGTRRRAGRVEGPGPGHGRESRVTERPTVGTTGVPRGNGTGNGTGSGPDTSTGSGSGSDTARVEQAALETGAGERAGIAGLLRTSVGRNLGLVVALVLLCLAGVITAGDR